MRCDFPAGRASLQIALINTSTLFKPSILSLLTLPQSAFSMSEVEREPERERDKAIHIVLCNGVTQSPPPPTVPPHSLPSWFFLAH